MRKQETTEPVVGISTTSQADSLRSREEKKQKTRNKQKPNMKFAEMSVD